VKSVITPAIPVRQSEIFPTVTVVKKGMTPSLTKIWQHPDVATTSIERFRRLANERHHLNLSKLDRSRLAHETADTLFVYR
jgi:hypothetical protein